MCRSTLLVDLSKSTGGAHGSGPKLRALPPSCARKARIWMKFVARAHIPARQPIRQVRSRSLREASRPWTAVCPNRAVFDRTHPNLLDSGEFGRNRRERSEWAEVGPQWPWATSTEDGQLLSGVGQIWAAAVRWQGEMGAARAMAAGRPPALARERRRRRTASPKRRRAIAAQENRAGWEGGAKTRRMPRAPCCGERRARETQATAQRRRDRQAQKALTSAARGPAHRTEDGKACRKALGSNLLHLPMCWRVAGRVWLGIGQSWPILGWRRPNLARSRDEFDQMWPDFGGARQS